MNDDQVTIFYEFPRIDPKANFAVELESEGAKGYVYMGGVLNTTSSGMPIYAKVRGKAAEYAYHFLPQPSTGADLLNQLNSEGAQGYRLTRRIFSSSGSLNAYIKETSRSSTQYDYRYLPPPNELDVFFQQTNEQGADGYRYWGSYNLPGYSSIYVKDLSQYLSSYVYEPTSTVSSSEEFLTKTNALGQQGYRFVSFQAVISQTKQSPNGIPLWWVFPLYYKDITQAGTYKYKVMPNPKSFPADITQLNEQAEQGYLFIGTQKFTATDDVILYYNWGEGAYDGLEIDAGF